MKVAFLVGPFPILSETFILNQIVGLMALGHEVHIYGHRPDNMSKVHSDVEKFQILKKTFYAPKIPKNYFCRVLKAVVLILSHFHQSPLVLLRSLDFSKYDRQALSLRMLYTVIPFLGKRTYDIIHCQFGMYGQLGLVLRDMEAIKGKMITSFRGYDISWYIQKYGEDVYDELFIKGDFFLANCEFFRHRAIELGCDENKITVHGSGIDCSRFSFKPRFPHPDKKIRIATTGRLVEKKGIEYGIRAIAKLTKTYSNVEYNIAGDGHLKEHLQQLIQELNVADKVNLLGWKNQKEIIDILNNSHIFIAPSITSEDGNQDAPVNTLKEAMAMGLPVIGTFHGGIPELVQDGISGFLVPECDADAIAQKLMYFIEHPEIWKPMGQAGCAYVNAHYDMNQLNNELVEIYQTVLKKPSQRNLLSCATSG